MFRFLLATALGQSRPGRGLWPSSASVQAAVGAVAVRSLGLRENALAAVPAVAGLARKNNSMRTTYRGLSLSYAQLVAVAERAAGRQRLVTEPRE